MINDDLLRHRVERVRLLDSTLLLSPLEPHAAVEEDGEEDAGHHQDAENHEQDDAVLGVRQDRLVVHRCRRTGSSQIKAGHNGRMVRAERAESAQIRAGGGKKGSGGARG